MKKITLCSKIFAELVTIVKKIWKKLVRKQNIQQLWTWTCMNCKALLPEIFKYWNILKYRFHKSDYKYIKMKKNAESSLQFSFHIISPLLIRACWNLIDASFIFVFFNNNELLSRLANFLKCRALSDVTYNIKNISVTLNYLHFWRNMR